MSFDEALVNKYDRRVARYTSYPTAPHFTSEVGPERYREWLSDLPRETPLSIYLHIPFCGALCWYCGCQAKVVNRSGPVVSYLAHLRQEIDLVLDVLGRGRPVCSMHWGGGTPNILEPADILALAETFRERFAIDERVEFSVEVDPRILTAEQARAFARAGVTRASFGVQDFDPEVQKAINRIQPYEKTKQAVDAFRDAGIDRINFDLLYGLPCQTREAIESTVDQAMGLSPDRIALFGYAHVPWMRRHQRLIDESTLPDGRQRLAFARAAARRIVEAGMVPVGLDHFAKPDDDMARALDEGRLRRNFQGYTVDPAEALIGFGASAIGSLPQGYVQNAPDVQGWRGRLDDGELPIVRGVALSDEDRLRRAVIERLMCELRVDLEAICETYDRPVNHFDDELASLAPMAEDGLIEIDGRHIRVPETGRVWVRVACAAFDQYMTGGDGQPRHSRAV